MNIMDKPKLLSWDSDFFSFRIGLIELHSNIIHEKDLKEVISDFKLIYLVSENPVKKKFECFYDCKIWFSIEEVEKSFIADQQVFLNNRELTPDLLQLTYESGHLSRFKRDPNFSEENFKKLYKAWIINSLKGDMADVVFVTKNKNKITGFVTVSISEKFGTVGLIAVSPKMRGMGLGKKLIERASNFCLEQNVNELRIPTQEENLKAINFYKKLGFKEISRKYIYHYWNT